MNRPVDQAGFSLLEVLITVFVVAVGLLSVAGMQALSKKSSYDAVQRTIATTLSQDILERIRSNSTQLSLYTGNTINGPLAAVSPACGTTTPAAAACTPAQLAAYDLYQWSLALDGSASVDSNGINVGGLVSASGCILAGATTGAVNIAIAWRGVTPLTGANPDTSTEAQCGAGKPAYDTVPGSGDGQLRRVLIVRGFVA